MKYIFFFYLLTIYYVNTSKCFDLFDENSDEENKEYQKFLVDVKDYVDHHPNTQYKRGEFDGHFSKFKKSIYNSKYKYGEPIASKDEPTLNDQLDELKTYGSISKRSSHYHKSKLSDADIVIIVISIMAALLCAVIIFAVLLGYKHFAKKDSYDINKDEKKKSKSDSTQKSLHGGQILDDSRMSKSAHLYHFHHQKAQMSKNFSLNAEITDDASSNEGSEADPEESEDIVYECPGLAPTGALEVRNPLFQGNQDDMKSPPMSPKENDH